ncbi:MAG: aminotransferase class I/II-fold pyridoxal phosphate-dependent enzyme [Planctomycetaceae bacterium]|nr:aminotransferase class I/II-fold pyridoxal phosphate-dependent enzyme [Planctomycetaceae bacterium]
MSSAARDRVAILYDPALVQELGQRMVRLFSQHLAQIEAGEGPVLNWRDPLENIAAARKTLLTPATNERLAERFEEMIQLALTRGHNLHHPRYIGHQVPAPVPIAGLFDALVSCTNQVLAIYEMGPWATAVERALIELWGEQIGLVPGTFAGLVTHGGSLANLTALLTARNAVCPQSWSRGLQVETRRMVMLVQGDVHYSIARSAGILGLGTEQVIRVPLDERRRMDAAALRNLVDEHRAAGEHVLAVVACACATPVGAFDPLDEIADVCEELGVWLHVDAAHGGAVAFSEKYRHLIRGLERADSFICDAHKTLFVPALCAFVFYRDKRHRFTAFQQEAPYLFDPSAPGMAEYDGGMLTVECTKRAAAYGLWGLTALCGKELFGDLIDLTFDLAAWLYEALREAPDFVPLYEPMCNIVVFRHVPEFMAERSAEQIGEFNRRIRRCLIESGEFYIVQTNCDGTGAIRVCVMNPLTQEEHVLQLLEAIRRVGRELHAAD